MILSKESPGMVLWVLSLLCSAILVIFAYYMYPVLDGDAIAFVPAIKAYAVTGILENKLIDLSYVTDSERQGRFLFYTPGFPFFFGKLLSFFAEKSYVHAVLLLALARAASVFIFAKALITVLHRSRRSCSVWLLCISSALVISNAFFLFASNGRPEILSTLIISIAGLAAVSFESEARKHLTLQACIGLLLPISIANAVIGLSFYLFYLFFDIRPIHKRVVYFCMAVLLSVAFLLLSYVLAGVPLVDGFQGLVLHSDIQLDRSDTQFSLALISFNWIVFGILSLSKLLQLSFVFLRDKRPSRWDVSWIAVSFAVLAFFVYFFWLRTPRSRYNFYAFLPLYQLLSFHVAAQIHFNGNRFMKLLVGGLLLVGVGLSLVLPLRDALLFPYYLTSGNTYRHMKYEFSKIPVDDCAVVHTRAIAFLDDTQSGSSYILDESRRVMLSERLKAEPNPRSCAVAFVQEVNSNAAPPERMELIADFSDRSRYTELLRSLRLLNSPKGYSFRSYKGDLAINQD